MFANGKKVAKFFAGVNMQDFAVVGIGLALANPPKASTDFFDNAVVRDSLSSRYCKIAFHSSTGGHFAHLNRSTSPWANPKVSTLPSWEVVKCLGGHRICRSCLFRNRCVFVGAHRPNDHSAHPKKVGGCAAGTKGQSADGEESGLRTLHSVSGDAASQTRELAKNRHYAH